MDSPNLKTIPTGARINLTLSRLSRRQLLLLEIVPTDRPIPILSLAKPSRKIGIYQPGRSHSLLKLISMILSSRVRYTQNTLSLRGTGETVASSSMTQTGHGEIPKIHGTFPKDLNSFVCCLGGPVQILGIRSSKTQTRGMNFSKTKMVVGWSLASKTPCSGMCFSGKR